MYTISKKNLTWRCKTMKGSLWANSNHRAADRAIRRWHERRTSLPNKNMPPGDKDTSFDKPICHNPASQSQTTTTHEFAENMLAYERPAHCNRTLQLQRHFDRWR
jgi:hypothetical protein